MKGELFYTMLLAEVEKDSGRGYKDGFESQTPQVVEPNPLSFFFKMHNIIKIKFKSFYNFTRGYDGSVCRNNTWKVKIIYFKLLGITLFKKRHVINLI